MEVGNTFGEIISSVLTLSSEDYDSSLSSNSALNGAEFQLAEHSHDQNIPNVPAAATIRCSNGESSNLATISTFSQHFSGCHHPTACDTYSAPPCQVYNQNCIQMPHGSQPTSQMPCQINYQNGIQMPNEYQTISQMPRQFNHQNNMQMPNISRINTHRGPSLNSNEHEQVSIQRRSAVPAHPEYQPQSWNNRSPTAINKPKRYRTAFTSEQLVELERQFKANQYLDRNKRLEMASVLGLNERTIKIWFQNRRIKNKRDKDLETSSPEVFPNK